MNINFEYDQVKASARLEALITKKLEKFEYKSDFILKADVFIKSENTSDPNKGKICKVRLSVPGPRLFAEASHGEFEQSVAEVIDDLQRQLKKKKEKMNPY